MGEEGTGRGRRRRGLRRAVTVAILALFGWIVGCTSRIEAPADVRDGVDVYLVTAAMHSGVVLPDGAGGWVEYGFGEYEWYANDRAQWYRAVPCVLWSTPGTLGRREFRAADPDTIRRRAMANRVDRVVVERARAEALRAQLAEDFAAAGEAIYQERYRMSFVSSGSYWFPSNCHDATAGWFEELGCEVSWRPVRMAIEMAE